MGFGKRSGIRAMRGVGPERLAEVAVLVAIAEEASAD